MIFHVLIGALIISFSPILAKAVGNTPFLTSVWRNLPAGVVFLLPTIWHHKKISQPRPFFLWCLISGIFFAADMACWHSSIVLVGAGLATLLANSQVLYMAFMSYRIEKEPLDPKLLLSVLLALIGLGMILIQSDFEFSKLGIINGLLAGIFYTGFMNALKKAGEYQSYPGQALGLVSIFTGIFLFPFAIIYQEPIAQTLEWKNLSLLLIYSFVVHFGGWLLISKALKDLSRATVGLFLLLQPFLSVIWGITFFNEPWNIRQLIGATCFLIALVLGVKTQKVSTN